MRGCGNMKKVFKLLLIFCLILAVFSMPAYAVDKDAGVSDFEIRPMFTYINTMGHYFDINRYGKATAEALLNAFGGDMLKVVVELQMYNHVNGTWNTIKTWSNTAYNDVSVGAGGTYNVIKDNMYRSVATGYVYKNGVVVEQHQMISSVKVYE